MKKTLVMALALTLTVAFAGCGNATDNTTNTETTPATTESTVAESTVEDTTEATDDAETTPADDAEDVKSEGVMTYAEYVAADLDTEVTVETYVQAKQSWWDNKVTVYCQSPDGAYFLYELACSEEDAAKLVPGTKIRVTGYKSEWSGEVEITDGTFEFVKGDSYIAEPLDVTDLLGTDELIDHQNEFVSFTGLTVAPSTDANGNEAAFLYNWDGSGEKGNDLYFNVTVNGQTYNFCVESYLCGQDTEVYQAVEALQIGDVINAEGFLYWYEGVNPHITSVSAAN